MKKYRAKATIYKLEAEDLDGLKAFEGRDIAELNPCVLVIKDSRSYHADVQIIAELRNKCCYAEAAYPVTNTEFFAQYESEEGILNLIKGLIKGGYFHWDELIAEYERREERAKTQKGKYDCEFEWK